MNIKMVKGKPARGASSNAFAGGNSNSHNSQSREDDGSGKPKRGLFGMFTKKKSD